MGIVHVLGRAIVHGWCHRFSKRGFDGTGKGNIEQSPGECVHGVLYRLEPSQLDLLKTFEGGYELALLGVECRGSLERAATFVARPPDPVVLPAPFYIEHYLIGMREHGLPQSYIDQVVADVPGLGMRADPGQGHSGL